MSNKMDELFRNKLEGVEATPSSEAWAELERKLNQGKTDNRLVMWWSIAASVAVVAVASWLVLSNQSTELDSNMIASNPEISQESPIQVQNEVIEKDAEEIIPKIIEEQVVLASTATSSTEVKKQAIPEVVEREIIKDDLVEEAPVLVAQLDDPVIDEDVANQGEQVGLEPIDAMTLATDGPIIAKFELNQPSLDFFETIPVTITYKAAEEVKEQKSFKQGIANMWNKAKKIKNGEEELFNIRDAKDNLLAFNFKKNKVKNSK